MSHFLKTAVEVIGVAVSIAAAIPSGGTSLLAAGFAGVGISVSAGVAAAIAAAATAALNFGAMALTHQPKPIVSPMAWTADPQAPIPYAMGRCFVGGNIVYRVAYGDHDKYDTLVTVLSGGGPHQSIDQLYVDGVACSIGAGGQVDIPDLGYMYAATQLGRTPEPRSILVGPIDPLDWTADCTLSGYAASMVTLVYDTKGKNTMTVEPQVGWVGHWAKVYDPRKDSTYPGGNGAHRAGVESSYEWSANPYLHALTWLLGRRANGKITLGAGMSASGILVDQFVEGANVADANGWTLGGTLTSDDDKWGRLKDMLMAGGGEPLQIGGSVGCLVYTPRVSLATVTDDDVVGPVSVPGTQSRRDRVNAIVPRYVAETSLTTADSQGALTTTVSWALQSADPVVVADYVAFDGGRQRQRQVDYLYVQNATQAAQLARYAIENARELGPITLPLKLRWMGYKPGDVVTLSMPRYGLVARDVLLLNRSLSTNGTVTLTCRTETAGKHAFALGQTSAPPATPTLTGPALVPTPGAQAWALTAGVIAADNGATQPVLELTGSPDSGVIDQVVIEYRVSTGSQDADADWQAFGTLVPSFSGKLEMTGLKDDTAYNVAVSYRKGSATGGRLILGPETCGQTAVPWQSGVVGAGKPQDGATVGAPEGTHVAGVLAEDVVSSLGALTDPDTGVGAAIGRIAAEVRAGAPNLLVNGDAAAGFDSWQGDLAAWGTSGDGDQGSHFFHRPGSGSGQSFIFQDVAVTAGGSYTASFECDSDGATAGQALSLDWLDGSGTNLGKAFTFAPQVGFGQRQVAPTVVAPGGAAHARVYLLVGDPSAHFEATRIMLQAGAATAWNDAADGARIASRTSLLEAQTAGTAQSGLSAAIGQAATAASDANDAAAQVQTNLTAAVRSGAPNLVVNGGFASGLDGWTATTSDWIVVTGFPIGPFAQGATEGSFLYQDVPVTAGTAYSLSAEMDPDQAGGGIVYIDWLDSGGGVIANALGLQPDGWQRLASPAEQAPIGAVKARVRIRAGAGGNTRATRVQFQQGEATQWRDDATTHYLAATVTTQAGVLAEASGKLTAYFSQVADVGGTGQVGIIAKATRASDGATISDLALIGGSLGFWVPKPDGSLVKALAIDEDPDGTEVLRFYGEVEARSIRADKIDIAGVALDNLDRDQMTANGSASVSGTTSGSIGGGPPTHVANLEVDLPVGTGGIIWVSVSADYAGSTNSGDTTVYNSVELLDGSGGTLASQKLPFGQTGSVGIAGVYLPFANAWGAGTRKVRLAVRGSSTAYSQLTNPAIVAGWSAL